MDLEPAIRGMYRLVTFMCFEVAIRCVPSEVAGIR